MTAVLRALPVGHALAFHFPIVRLHSDLMSRSMYATVVEGCLAVGEVSGSVTIFRADFGCIRAVYNTSSYLLLKG
eukprot:1321947-Amphidinium_carterae.2